MNALAQQIQSLGLASTPPAEIVAAYDADVVIRDDASLYTVGQLDVVLTALDAEKSVDYQRLVIGTIKAVAEQDPLVWGYSQKLFSGDGLPFNSPKIQALIDTLAQVGSWPDVVRDAIKRIGIVYGKLWEKHGIERLPTEDECKDALAQIENVAWIESELEPLITQLKAAGGTLDATKAAVAANVGA